MLSIHSFDGKKMVACVFISQKTIKPTVLILGLALILTLVLSAYSLIPEARAASMKQPLFGWGGYISSTVYVVPILIDLAQKGYTAIRYWAQPYWLYGSGFNALDFAVLDYLVQQAASRNIVVYIDGEHNYPASAYLSGNVQTWINDLITIGQRYASASNVVLECVNEYTGSDQPTVYNRAITTLRTAGIHLPLLFNFWWNQPNVALTDPDNNYAIGRHFYGSSFDTYNAHTPMNLQEAVNQSGINVSMYHYFGDPTKDMYLQSVLALNIPNGWVVSEFGPTDNESMVDNPSVGNMAYAMQFLREAATHNVTVMNYRIGTYSKEGLYEATALTDFNQPYFTPPQPPTATLLDLVALAKAYGSTLCSPNWNPASDMNKDGVVNLKDLTILVQYPR